LDASTNGGLGIALLSPFDNTRLFFPWTPIEVSPIGVKAFFSTWGLVVIKSELQWIWLPSFMLAVLSTLIRGLAARH
jgi:inner membrane protein